MPPAFFPHLWFAPTSCRPLEKMAFSSSPSLQDVSRQDDLPLSRSDRHHPRLFLFARVGVFDPPLPLFPPFCVFSLIFLHPTERKFCFSLPSSLLPLPFPLGVLFFFFGSWSPVREIAEWFLGPLPFSPSLFAVFLRTVRDSLRMKV